MNKELTSGLIDLPALVRENFKQHEYKGLGPIGGIIYAQNKKLVLLAEDDDGSLKSASLESPQNIDVNSFMGWDGRVQILNHYDEISIVQVPLMSAVIGSSRSIRSRPSVSIKIPFRELENHNYSNLTVKEDDILKVFTGKQGGLLVFEGGDLPDENALVLERRVNELRYGLVFFFHPEQSKIGIDSGNGLYIFLQRLNEQFTLQDPGPIQKKALGQLEKDIEKGYIKFSDIRLELFRTQIIAYARMADNTGEGHYFEFLRAHLRGMEPNLIIRLMESLRGEERKRERRLALDRSIDLLLEGSIRSSEKREFKKPQGEVSKDVPIIDRLKTERIKTLRGTLRELPTGGPVMNLYMQKIVEAINDADEKEEFADLFVLLDELWDSKYCSTSLTYILKGSDKKTLEFISFWDSMNNSYPGLSIENGSRLIEKLRAFLINRQDIVLYKSKGS